MSPLKRKLKKLQTLGVIQNLGITPKSSEKTLGIFAELSLTHKRERGESMSYKEEHPYLIAPSDFRLDELEELGFEDISWKNDGCPFFENEKHGLNLHVDYQEELSDVPSDPFMRYHLLRYDYDIETKEYDQSGSNADLLISSNTFADIIKAIKEKLA